MANQSKLKAWVRYDGTGRVVTAGPIFQANKPKVGNWRQINSSLCCNPNSSTTTTTTQGGGSVTPTAWFGQIAYEGASSTWAWNACNGFGISIIVYTATETAPFAPGTALYSDAALTTPIPYSAAAISIQGTVYDVVNGQTNPLGGTGQSCSGITTTTTTTTTPISVYRVAQFSYSDAQTACANSAEINNGSTLFAPGSEYQVGAQLYYDELFNFQFSGTGWYPVMTQWPSGITKNMYLLAGQIQSSANC